MTLEGEHGGIGGGGKKWQFGFPGTDNTDGQGGGGLRVDEERWREKEVKEEEEGEKGEDGWRKMRFKERHLVRLL